MAETIKITAEARDRAGKGAARAARRAGMIPGVIYGDNKPPVLFSVNAQSLLKILRDPAALTHIYDIEIGKERHHVLARDIALDPVSDKAIHLDFLRVSDKTRVHADVPVHFINEEASPGLKRGGVLNIVRHDVELVCSAEAIPEFLSLDLSGAEIGDSLRMSAIKLPDGVQVAVKDRDFVIATVAAPSAVRAEAAEAAAAAATGETPAAEEPAAKA
ncbi:MULTISPECIES: 50S ribosomal protein L25/general stress protein Ctc [Inquilinus]|uniref:Large ribosomal subunit protein bL25 n=1 Tax=Inquilinus ginsengisoli TaxID=363840 RepID=A0ABU1JZ79_9PROT|nr:50S ribosomal protein L25/general stress protein Ctc [Inquilinus ginsengisoli]MDR6293577.1 large subunit ribosomal protein L25 [Inquilinus ginsengisoli]